MGNALPALLKTNCFHDLIYYVLNESECHSTCADFCSCGCETHQVEQPEGDSGSEIEVEVENCCSIRKT